MKKAPWELSVAELDEEIAVTRAILDSSGYFKIVADHLAMLQSEREERLIEEGIIENSKLGKEWRGT